MEIIAVVVVVLFLVACVKLLSPRKPTQYDIGKAPKYSKKSHGK
jgi:hypothetical protein